MTNAQHFLKQAQLYSDDELYLMISLPPAAITAAAGVLAEIGEPFAALVVDKDELTLMIPAVEYEEFAKRLPGARISEKLRLITFDVVLPPDLTGFMALVGNLLSAAQIPIIPIGAYERDHLLVPAERFEEAWGLLKEQQNS